MGVFQNIQECKVLQMQDLCIVFYHVYEIKCTTTLSRLLTSLLQNNIIWGNLANPSAFMQPANRGINLSIYPQ